MGSGSTGHQDVHVAQLMELQAVWQPTQGARPPVAQRAWCQMAGAGAALNFSHGTKAGAKGGKISIP